MTLNPDPPELQGLLEPLQNIVSRYAMAGYIPVVTEDYVWDTNLSRKQSVFSNA